MYFSQAVVLAFIAATAGAYEHGQFYQRDAGSYYDQALARRSAYAKPDPYDNYAAALNRRWAQDPGPDAMGGAPGAGAFAGSAMGGVGTPGAHKNRHRKYKHSKGYWKTHGKHDKAAGAMGAGGMGASAGGDPSAAGGALGGAGAGAASSPDAGAAAAPPMRRWAYPQDPAFLAGPGAPTAAGFGGAGPVPGQHTDEPGQHHHHHHGKGQQHNAHHPGQGVSGAPGAAGAVGGPGGAASLGGPAAFGSMGAGSAGLGPDPSAGAPGPDAASAAGGPPGANAGAALGGAGDPSAAGAPPMRRWADPEAKAFMDAYPHLFARDAYAEAEAEAWANAEAEPDFDLYERDAEPEANYDLYERDAEPDAEYDLYERDLYERDLYERDAYADAEADADGGFEERDVDDLYSFMY